MASASGVASFTFAAPPTGLAFTGTLTCGGAPTTAIFVATIGATSWGDWAGNSVYGPVQALSNQQLIVTATGLTPNTSFELVWAGSSDSADAVQPIYPDTNVSALSVALATTQGSVDLLYSNAAVNFVGGVAFNSPNLTALHSYQAILVVVTGNSGSVVTVTTDLLIGVISALFPPQTQTIQPFILNGVFAMPFACAVGNQIIVSITQSITAAGQSVTIYGLSTELTQQVIAPVGMPLSTYQVGGSKVAFHTFAGAGTFALLAAPPVGFAYLLKRLSSPNAAVFNVTGLTTGSVYGALTAAIPTDPIGGIPAGEGINLNAAAAGTAYLFYDIVPVPTVT